MNWTKHVSRFSVRDFQTLHSPRAGSQHLKIAYGKTRTYFAMVLVQMCLTCMYENRKETKSLSNESRASYDIVIDSFSSSFGFLSRLPRLQYHLRKFRTNIVINCDQTDLISFKNNSKYNLTVVLV